MGEDAKGGLHGYGAAMRRHNRTLHTVHLLGYAEMIENITSSYAIDALTIFSKQPLS